MSDLSARERRKFEELFGMNSGYVLDFSNRTYADFFADVVGVDIMDFEYEDLGTSKANRLRSFWIRKDNALVGKALRGMLNHCREEDHPATKNLALFQECEAIATRLHFGDGVADIEAIQGDSEDFEMVAKAARECFERNEPEQGLDRLHTFLVKFLRKLCAEHEAPRDRSVPLGGLMGTYVKQLKERGLLTSQMAEHILKGSISIFGQFDHVRNNHSMAHDNPVLSYDEALLIASNVASTVRFIRNTEAKAKNRV